MKIFIIPTILLSLFLSFRSYSQCNVIPISTNSEGLLISGDYRIEPGIGNNCNNITKPTSARCVAKRLLRY